MGQPVVPEHPSINYCVLKGGGEKEILRKGASGEGAAFEKGFPY